MRHCLGSTRGRDMLHDGLSVFVAIFVCFPSIACSELTGVELITTAGGNLGFMLLPFGLEAPPAGPNRSMSPCWTTFERPEGWLEAWSPALAEPPGIPLLRPSLRVEVDDDGVRAGELLDGSRDDGDAAPSLDSLFFLEDLLGSLPARESCWA